MLGWQELLLIALFILVFFGAKRIPDIARAFGRASYEFKKAKKDLTKESKLLFQEAEAEAARNDKRQESQKNDYNS